MGKYNNITSQAVIDSSIEIVERNLVYYVLSAAIQDGLGNWEKAECLIRDSKWVMLDLGILESNCPDAIKHSVPGSQVTPSINPSIGSFTIGVKPTMFTILGSNKPPPYGEFTVVEFIDTNVTEVVTI